MIGGDLNARTGSEQPKFEEMTNYWHSADDEDEGVNIKRSSKDSTINMFGKSLLDFCFTFDMIIVNGSCQGDVVGEFTFVATPGSSVVDYFIVSKEMLLNCDLHVGNCLYSWHLPVELKWKTDKRVKQECTWHEKREEKVVWSEENVQKYKNEIDSDEFKKCIEKAKSFMNVDINECIEVFTNALYGAAACMVRKIGAKKKTGNDWFDEECRKMKKRVKSLLRSFRRSKTDLRTRREAFVNAKKEYNKLMKLKKREHYTTKLQTLKKSIKDPKLFWSTIRSINRKSVIYNEISSQQWYDHFFHVFNPDSFEDIRLDDSMVNNNSEGTDEPLFNDPITRKEIQNSINHLKRGKSAGPDKIIGDMLKQANTEMIDFLLVLFNSIFSKGTFPKTWSKSIIIPIFKKGDANNPDNYRGIALTSILGKVYTHILNKRLTEWTEREEKIIEEQAGFRARYSTVDHIFTLYAIVQTYLNRNSKLYVAFVDFKKAFDSVNRNILWNVLRNSGINGKMYMALRGIYDSVSACVRDKCIYTDFFDCPRGVKQGCLLSPKLFSFFINELATELSKKGRHGIQMIPGAIEMFLMLFADDVILFSNTVVGLQNQINMLKQETDRLHLCVNLEKTNILVFRKGGHLSKHEKWWYGNTEVKVSNSYKYLGMIFTTKLSLTAGWIETSGKAKKGIIEILRSLKKLNCIDPILFWKLFDTQIEPLLTYAAEIWGPSENKQMEKVHTFAIKRFLNVPLHSSNKVCYGETGRYPLKIRTTVKCIKYWLKLISLPMSRLCRQAYEMLMHEHERGKLNWILNVKKILTENGFGIVWISQGVGNESKFISEFRDRLICSYKQNWHSQMVEEEKYEWFMSFKNIFQTEKYLTVVTNKWHRDSLARLRTRTLGLNANKTWFTLNTPSTTSCPLCSGIREDEFHFIFHCKEYDFIRNKCELFKLSVADRNDLMSILSTQNQQILLSLAKFIAEANDFRKKKMSPVE